MIEYDRNKQNNLAEKAALKICVAGVGGAGSNVIDRITLDRSVEADLACFHTDVRVLNHGMAPTKVQLGGDLMKGVGAGGDPDLGREAALFSKEHIRQTLAGHDIVFICTGLGGGTGSGAAPVVAEIAKGCGALVVVLATMPFSFEGRRRLNQAEEALELLQKRADALVLFDNNRMGELVLPKEGIQKAFTLADQTLAQCARAVAVMVSTPGLVKLGLDDLMSALNASNGRCLFGFGEAKGNNRGTDALKKALKSPLIDSGRLLQETKNLLAHIVGGESLTLMEVDAIMKNLGRSVPEQTQILFGLAVDPKMGDSISVTLISSLGLEQLAARPAAAPEVVSAPVAPPVAEIARPPAAEKRRAATPSPLPPPPAPEAKASVEEEPMELFAAGQPETHAASAPAVHEVEEDEIEPEAQLEYEDSVTTDEDPQEEAEVHEEFVAEEEAEDVDEDADEPIFADESEEEQPVAVAAVTPPARPAPAAPVAPVAHAIVREPTPATAPVPSPVAVAATTTVRPRKNERQTTSSRGVLAAVLSGPSAVASHVAAAEEVVTDFEPVTSSYAPAAASRQVVAAGAAARGEQQTFRLGDEDRGRFKDTEPSMSDGEDLDVPTWMRLRKKPR